MSGDGHGTDSGAVVHAGNGMTVPYRVVGALLTVVVVGGLGYGLVQTIIKAAALFAG